MTQLAFELTPPDVPPISRHTSGMSVRTWRELVASQTLPKRRLAVLLAIADMADEFRRWPTTSELCRFMVERRLLPREAPNLVSGRVNELVAAGVCEWGTPRACRVSGRVARPVQIVRHF